MNKRQRKKRLKQRLIELNNFYDIVLPCYSNFNSNYCGDYNYISTRDYYNYLRKELAFRYPNDLWNSCNTSAFANFDAYINHYYGLSCTSWYVNSRKWGN